VGSRCCTGRDLMWAVDAVLGGTCFGQEMLYWNKSIFGSIGAVLEGICFQKEVLSWDGSVLSKRCIGGMLYCDKSVMGRLMY
jgi:hypothetical protein